MSVDDVCQDNVLQDNRPVRVGYLHCGLARGWNICQPIMLAVMLHMMCRPLNSLGFTMHRWCYLPTGGVIYPQVVLFTHRWCYLPTGGVVYPQVVLFSHRWCYLVLFSAHFYMSVG